MLGIAARGLSSRHGQVGNAMSLRVLGGLGVRRMSQVKHNPSWMITKLGHIADTHVNQNDYANALLVLQKSLDICKTYTPSKYYLSKEEYEHSEEIKQRVLPSKFLVHTFISLAKVYAKDKQMEPAKEHFEKALEVANRTYDTSDRRRLDVIIELGAFYFDNELYKEAKELFFEVKGIMIKYGGPPGVYTKHHGISNYYLGMIEFIHDNYELALKYSKQSLVTYRTLYSPFDLRIAHVIASLGDTYYALEKYTEAREHVEYAGMIYGSRGINDKLAHLEELHGKIIQHIPGAKGLLPPLKLLRDNTFEPMPINVKKEENL